MEQRLGAEVTALGPVLAWAGRGLGMIVVKMRRPEETAGGVAESTALTVSRTSPLAPPAPAPCCIPAALNETGHIFIFLTAGLRRRWATAGD